MWAQVLALALPALAQQYLLFVIQQYDQFLARGFSPAHQAALTAANYLYWMMSSYAVVVSAGATAVIGRCVGAGDRSEANRVSGQVVVLAAGFGLMGTVGGLLFGGNLIALLNLSDTAAPVAETYFVPLFLALVPQLVTTGGIACLVGAGDTRTGLFVLAGVAGVNVPTAYWLAFGVGPLALAPMGFVGIAWGTALSQLMGGVAVLALLLRGRSGLKIGWRDLIPDYHRLMRLLRVSVPAAADSLSATACQMWFLSIVNQLGDDAGAAHGIALRWEALGYLAGAAFGTAAVSLVSRNLGAGRPDVAARGGWTSLALGGGLMTVVAAGLFAFAEPLCWVYSPANEEVVRLGAVAMRVVAFAQLPLAAVIVLTQAVRGAGDTRVPVLFSWVGFLGVRIPLAYYLFDWGLRGLWLAMLADIWVRGLLFVARFWGGRWKRVRV